MLSRLRNESGMTLPEVLTSITIGAVVTLAGFGLVETAMRQSGETNARIDAVQNGRMAMDTMTRQLRSQACLRTTAANNTLPRAVEAGTDDSLTFYADMRDISNKATATPTPTPAAGFVDGPERRTLTFVASANPKKSGKIYETRWKPTDLQADGKWVYGAAGTQRVVLDNVDRAKERQADGTYKDIPVFRFYAYDFNLTVPQPEALLTTPLSVSDAQKVAKIKITYRSQPSNKRADDRLSTKFSTDVFVRTVDPNAETAELNNPCL